MADRSAPSSAETKLFGEVPLSDSENDSPQNSPSSAEMVRTQNELNNARSREKGAAPAVSDSNGKTILDVAVIDIDEGKFFSPFWCGFFIFIFNWKIWKQSSVTPWANCLRFPIIKWIWGELHTMRPSATNTLLSHALLVVITWLNEKKHEYSRVKHINEFIQRKHKVYCGL